MKEEILVLQEELKKTCLNAENFEQDLNEEIVKNTKLENELKNVKHMLDIVSKECCSLKTEFENIIAVNEANLKCNQNLQNEKDLLKNERTYLSDKVLELTSDIDVLKKELVDSEKIRLQIESEKKSIGEKLCSLQKASDKLEELLCESKRGKEDASNNLTAVMRKNDFLNTELLRLKQRIEQATQINNRLNKNIEELIKQNEQKQLKIDALEKETSQLKERNTTILTERNAIEGRLHDSLSTIDKKNSKIIQLEGALNEQIKSFEKVMNQLQLAKRELEMSEKNLTNLKIKFTTDISKLENDFVQKLSKLKQLIDDNILQFNAEKSFLQSSSEKRLQEALYNLELNKNKELEKFKVKYNALQDQYNVLIQQHDEALLNAENDKQNVYNCAQKEKQLILLRLDQTLQDLEKEKENHIKSKRDAKNQHDQDTRTISSLKDEVVTLKNELENLTLKFEDEKHSSDVLISKANEEKDYLFKDISELKTQIKLEEDRNNELKARSSELLVKLNECKYVQ